MFTVSCSGLPRVPGCDMAPPPWRVKSRLAHCSIPDTTEPICFTTRPNCCRSLPAAARPGQAYLGNIPMLGSPASPASPATSAARRRHPGRASFPLHQRATLSIAYRYRHCCCTGPACSVFVPRRILDITYYVFISDPGNFQACMSVYAIPVLPPCGDKLKRGAAGRRNEDRETLRGHCLIGANSTSLNTAKPKPTTGFLSRSPGGISVGICRTALVFPTALVFQKR